MKRFLPLACLTLALAAGAQETAKTSDGKTSIDTLKFMHGTWKGEGWIIAGKNDKHSFKVTTKVDSKLRGKVLFLEQEGTETGDGPNKDKPFMDMIATFALNPEQTGFLTHSVSGDGTAIDGDGQMEDGKLVFAQVNGPNLFSRYTIEVKDGVWKQKGELTDDGKRYFTFMEMTLKKS